VNRPRAGDCAGGRPPLAVWAVLAGVLLATALALAPGSYAAGGIVRFGYAHGVVALEATPDHVLVARIGRNALHPKTYVRLDAYPWGGSRSRPVPFQLTCGTINNDQENAGPNFSMDEAGGLVAVSAVGSTGHYFQGGVMLTGLRRGNAVCGEFDAPFGSVQSAGPRLLQTLPPRRECVDGTRAPSCPLLTPIVSLNTRKRLTVAPGAFRLVAARGDLAIGAISNRAGEAPRIVALDLSDGSERWSRPAAADSHAFGATDGARIVLSEGSRLLVLSADSGAVTQTWRNVHFALSEIGLAGGLVSWFAHSTHDPDGTLVYVRDAAGKQPPHVLATLPRGWSPVDLRLTARGLAWAATRIGVNEDRSRGGAVWMAPAGLLRAVLRR
jgi:hypothetical protein